MDKKLLGVSSDGVRVDMPSIQQSIVCLEMDTVDDIALIRLRHQFCLSLYCH
jgi:hypothetical protein